jgi:hypothetical protein
MTFAVRRHFAVGLLFFGSCGILALAPSALADGGAGGSGSGAVTGPGATTLGTLSGSVAGTESIPGGAPGTLGCLTGGCSGSLTAITNIVPGPGGTPPPAGLYITPTVNLPQPSIAACLTAQCHGNGGLSIGGGVSTPIVGATGGLNGYVHG